MLAAGRRKTGDGMVVSEAGSASGLNAWFSARVGAQFRPGSELGGEQLLTRRLPRARPIRCKLCRADRSAKGDRWRLEVFHGRYLPLVHDDVTARLCPRQIFA